MRPVKTWIPEAAVVGVILGGSLLLSPVTVAAVLTAAAVFASFLHVQVADRLQEHEAVRAEPAVPCHYKLKRYLILKEVLWVLTFVLLQAWPALVGCGIFLAYPIWRRFYRKSYPLKR